MTFGIGQYFSNFGETISNSDLNASRYLYNRNEPAVEVHDINNNHSFVIFCSYNGIKDLVTLQLYLLPSLKALFLHGTRNLFFNMFLWYLYVNW